MNAVQLPATAAWRHVAAREGFEVLFLQSESDAFRFEGTTAAVEEGVTWSVRYAIEVDAGWVTRRAHVVGRSAAGERELHVERDDGGGWLLDGVAAPELAGCEDLDLEASAFTNAFPVHRLAPSVGEAADAPAAYVRAPNLRVARLEQRYVRLPDRDGKVRYEYSAPAFEYHDVLLYDDSGLVLEYPGLAARVA